MPLVFTTHRLHLEAEALLAGKAKMEVASALDSATLEHEAQNAEIIIVRAPIHEGLLDKAPRLKAMIRHGAGLDMIPVEAATERGVLVANVPGVNAPSVAEHVLMTSLMLLRRVPSVDRLMRAGQWHPARMVAEHGVTLRDKSVGIVGYGAVGEAVATTYAAMGCRVRAYSPRRPVPPGRKADLADVFATSDIIVLCCPLTPETRHMVNAATLAAMRPTSFLINVSRGAVIDDEALVKALRTGGLAGAALDVFERQPLAAGHPYFDMPNVVLSPHVAGLTADSMRAMSLAAAEEALRVLRGELPLNLVNPAAIERLANA